MFVVGLTGGIGSGKSTVANHFSQLGVQVVDADLVAREIVEPGQPALEKIISHFGSDVVDDKRQLNRAFLRQKIFNSPSDKQWLESLLHPLIRGEIQRQLVKASSAYSVLAVPLLLESGDYKWVNRVLVIDVPESIQIERASARDNNDTDLIKSIIATQIGRDERLASADDVIDNSGTEECLKKQVSDFHKLYCKLANDTSHETGNP